MVQNKRSSILHNMTKVAINYDNNQICTEEQVIDKYNQLKGALYAHIS